MFSFHFAFINNAVYGKTMDQQIDRSHSCFCFYYTALSFTYNNCSQQFVQTRRCPVDRILFKVIKCFHLQSALDILDQLFHSLCRMPIRTPQGERLCMRVCEHAILYMLYEASFTCHFLKRAQFINIIHWSGGRRATKGHPQPPYCSLASLLV